MAVLYFRGKDSEGLETGLSLLFQFCFLIICSDGWWEGYKHHQILSDDVSLQLYIVLCRDVWFLLSYLLPTPVFYEELSGADFTLFL